MEIIISKSSNPKKKYDALIDNKKKISFGQAGASDYTLHHDDKRKQNYVSRHANENHNISNIASPAYMSRMILWNKHSISASIKDLNNKYKNVKFILK